MDTSDDPTGFASLGLHDELLDALGALGYTEPTPIQREAIPVLLDGHDVLGQAATGTGKTAAFALPIVARLNEGRRPGAPMALVLAPTRELAAQVADAFDSYGKSSRVKTTVITGGQPFHPQLKALDRGVHVVVATPGRALDHLKRGSLDLSELEVVVLDEADEMLDMGFAEDLDGILNETPEDRQTVLFSATLPPRITSIANRHQNDPIKVKISKADSAATHALIEQRVYMVHKAHKPRALGRILALEQPTSAIVFCKTRTDVDELTVAMNGRDFRAEALHGGMDQAQRDRVMARLRNGTADLLIATDVAARGLDVDTLSHVVNYDLPNAPESYVHRIGRVGRAGREGVAITLANPRQGRLLKNIEHLTGQKIQKASIPSADDLKAKRMEAVVDTLRESLQADDLDEFRAMHRALGEIASDRDIALAALRTLSEMTGSTVDEDHIPDASDDSRDRKGGKGRGAFKERNRGSKHERGGNGRGNRSDRSGGDEGFVYIAMGRKSGVRPGDLVGAIANETGIPGRDIGPIRVSDNYSVVGVPNDSVDDVVKAIERSTVKGKKTKARRYVS